MCDEDRYQIEKYLKFYLILETEMLQMPLETFIDEVVSAGVTAIQLRDKNLDVNQRVKNGEIILKSLKNRDTLLVINDRIDLALSLGVNAVHLGAKDIPLKVAKEIFKEFTFGYSCNNLEDLLTARDAGAHYIGVGPAFWTDTKKDLREVLGPDGIKNLLSNTNIPAVAIGGISSENVHLLRNTGICGIAISSAVCKSKTPGKEVLKILSKL